MSGRSHILLVDSYDSFTFNLAALCRQAIPTCCIHIIKNDQFTLKELVPFLKFFVAVVVGPGPGSPEILEDIGIVTDLWKLSEDHLVPIFGVCLGLQSLSIEFGAQLKRLNVVKHGQTSRIYHRGIELFDRVGTVDAVRYHSLHVTLQNGGEIEQLAWTQDGPENGMVVMAVKHRSRPFWAVQYHPESARTTSGLEVFNNFWDLAQKWTKLVGRTVPPWDNTVAQTFGRPWPPNDYSLINTPRTFKSDQVITSSLELPELTAQTVCELFGVMREASPFILLDSAAKPSRLSIIASLMPTSLRVTYFVGDCFVTLTKGNSSSNENLGLQDIWSWLASFMRSRRIRGGSPEIPFWGGLVGYLSYEIGIYSLPVTPKERSPDAPRHPDVNFIFVERSVVLDSVSGKVFVQSILPEDGDWIAATCMSLKQVSLHHHNITSIQTVPKRRTVLPSFKPVIALPDKRLYISRVKLAKESLFAGDSYELCLTARSHIFLPKVSSSCDINQSSSWALYKTLRANNPAPYSAYLRLGPTTLISSSPERFLSFSRPPNTTCQLRPIKGTLRKGPLITRAVAEKALAGNIKEVAENLMIVDLIRHDLYGVIGEDVEVKQFCAVEEYETMWQLVSVIEGRSADITASGLDAAGELGWEVLKKTLPPGSMTGAPKKRSVEILQTLEDDERGIYSGVFGYWCVGGGGDWSVTIRSCFKFDKQFESTTKEEKDMGHDEDIDEWVIGAGGAITALSEPEAEWDEMIVKLQSVLSSFGVDQFSVKD